MPWPLTVYLLTVNLLACLLVRADKRRARRGAWRVPERTLWLCALAGGTPLMLTTMLLIRHKTRKPAFMLGLPLLLCIQLALCLYLRTVA